MDQFQVRRDDLRKTRIVSTESRPLADAELRVAVERFSFTANNVTYGVVGEQIGYWQFFPALGEDNAGWGVLPVWGFGTVSESNHPGITRGERLFGYFPPAGEVTLAPGQISAESFYDTAAHRAQLPAGYNLYRRVEAEPGYNAAMDDHRALLYPLHVTAFCLWDALADRDWYDAEQVLITSASSKTSIGLAFALSEDATAPRTVGLTSARNAGFVGGLGYYEEVITYDALQKLDNSRPAVIVDMSGDAELQASLHRALGDNMRQGLNVGMTHWEDSGTAPQDIIAERTEFFFAPGHIQKRLEDWGAGVFGARSTGFLQRSAEASTHWLRIRQEQGLAALQALYPAVCEGHADPAEGLIITL